MKRTIVISLVVLALALALSLGIPALANDPDTGGPADGQAGWQEMHQACEDGDWEAMEEAADAYHGQEVGDMPCHDEDEDSGGADYGWGDMGDHMDDHMGGGWGGMMGGWGSMM